jgi:signal peptidase I
MLAWVKFAMWSAGLIGLALYAIHSFVLEAWRVPTDDPMLAASVEPTLSAGDWVLVWRGDSFARGNLLRCPDPQAPGRYVVARAMGAPGDHLEIRGEIVTLDGRRPPNPRACDQPSYTMLDPGRQENVELGCTVEEYGDMDFSALRAADHLDPPTVSLVPPDKWFMVSDNRHIHVDSRDYGELDAAVCRHIVFRLVGAGGLFDRKKRLTVVW